MNNEEKFFAAAAGKQKMIDAQKRAERNSAEQAPMPDQTPFPDQEQPQRANEQMPTAQRKSNLIFEGTGSQWQNLGAFIMYGMTALFCGLFTIVFPPLFVLVVLSGIGAFLTYWRVESTKYVIDTNNIEVVSGIFNRSTDNIMIITIRDVKYSQSFTDRMFGMGTIYIVHTGMTGNVLAIRSIVDSNRVYAALREQTQRIANTQGVVRY